MMNAGAVIVIVVIWWWLAFLAVLPRHVKGRWESGDDGVKGADPGAPVNPELKQKAWLATKISAVLSLATIGFILSGVLDFRG
jgi:predicted secreted protein